MSGPVPFTVDVLDDDGRLVVVPRGELDMATAPDLERLVLPPLEDGRWVLLDLRSLDFIDSSGLRIVVSAHRVTQQGAGRFTAVRGLPGSAVARIIEIAGIDAVIEMVDDPDEPIAAG